MTADHLRFMQGEKADTINQGKKSKHGRVEKVLKHSGLLVHLAHSTCM